MLNMDLEYRILEFYIRSFNIVLNIDLGSEYRTLHCLFEYSAEYRPGGPNIELHIRSLNIILLLPIYWYALSFEDYHQWSARLKT